MESSETTHADKGDKIKPQDMVRHNVKFKPVNRLIFVCLFDLCLTPLSAIFQLYHGDQF